MPGILDHQTNQNLRERDVRRSFIMINAEHCPVTSMAAKGEAPKSSLIEWPMRVVPDATDDAGVMDGVDVVDGDFQDFEATKALLQGRLQKIREGTAVGDIAENTTKQYPLGSVGLWKDYVTQALMKLRSKMERVTISNKDSQAQSGGSTPFLTRGLSHWIGKGNAGDLPLATAFTRTPATSIFTTAVNTDLEDTVTEDIVRRVMRSIFTNARKKGNWYLFCTPLLKEQFSNFLKTGDQTSTKVPLRRFTGDASASEITLDVQRYTGDWGTLTLVPHLSLPAKVFGLLLDMDYVKLRMVRNARFKELEDRGGGPRGFVDAIFAVCDENPTAHGKFIQAT